MSIHCSAFAVWTIPPCLPDPNEVTSLWLYEVFLAPPVCPPCCLHRDKFSWDAFERAECPQYRLWAALEHAVWPWGELSGETGKGERQIGQNFFFSPHWSKSRQSTLLQKIQQSNQPELLHLCSELWEQQYLRSRGLCDTAKHLLGCNLKLPSSYQLFQTVFQWRCQKVVLSGRYSWPSAFLAPAGRSARKCSGRCEVEACSCWVSLAAFAFMPGCVWVDKRGEQVLKERNKTCRWT